MFALAGEGSHRTPEKIETSKYYDVVNFARRLRVPGLYSWGYNDATCPPTSMYSAYNVITAPKTLPAGSRDRSQHDAGTSRARRAMA
jgi:cephalosporin-C deacetylase-like acetyl esterase